MAVDGSQVLKSPSPATHEEIATARLVPETRRAVTLWPALATGLLLWLCYFPVNQGWLAWFALVPLLTLVDSQARPLRLYVSAWLGGLLLYLAAIQWMRVADYRMYATWIGLALYCSLFFPLAIFLLRRLTSRTRLSLVVTVPVVWTALEYFRAEFGTGFPWYFLSHTQHAALPVIQISDLGGAYMVTFLVAAANALVFEMLRRQGWFRRLFALLDRPRPGPAVLGIQAGAFLLLLAGTLGYGLWRLEQAAAAEGPRVALIQGNLDQRIRIAASDQDDEQAATTMVRHYRDLSDAAARQSPPPDLIVWPETSFPISWQELSPALGRESLPPGWRTANERRQQLIHDVSRRWHTNVLLGLTAEELAADRRALRYNSAVLIAPGDRYAGRYDKMHRVPFGEYVPFRDWLPWMNALAPYDFDYSVAAGQHFTRFPLGQCHFGVIICYEDTDPDLARRYAVADGQEPAADFLVNISNDGWFDGTSEHEEHLAISRFRAVECRRAVARAVNMGISAVIDGNGRVVNLPGPTWARSKKVAAVLTAAIPLDHRWSLYCLWGDWFAWSCWFVLAAGLAWSWLPRRRAKLV